MSRKPKRRRRPTGPARRRTPGRWLGAVAAFALLAGLWLARASNRPSLDLAEVPGSPGEATDARVRETIQRARRAVAADPRSGRTWGRLGTVLHAHQREPEAAVCYRRAAALDPEEPRWPYLLAVAVETSDPAAALGASGRAVELAPGYAPAQVLHADLLEQEGETEAARSHYRKALALDARCAACELGLGRLALAAGDPEASLRHLERAVALQPGARSPQALLARAHRRLGDAEKARRAAKQAARLDGEPVLRDPFWNGVVEQAVSPMGYQRRAALADAMGRQTKAEALYRTLLEAHPEDADGHYNLGNLLARLGRTEEAAASYRRALEIAPDKTEARFNLGNTLLREGRLADAEREYRTALEAWPDHTGTLTNLGNLLARRGRFGEAADAYRRAVEADPENPIAHHQLGQLRAREGRLREAIAHYRAALEARPDAGPIHLDLARALALLGDRSGAWERVEAARRAGAAPSRELLEALGDRSPEAGSP